MAKEEREDAANMVEETKNVNVNESAKPAASKPAREGSVTTGRKNVRIRITEPVDCIIAGVAYKFSKDKEAQVPADVAGILCYSKKAYRL